MTKSEVRYDDDDDDDDGLRAQILPSISPPGATRLAPSLLYAAKVPRLVLAPVLITPTQLAGNVSLTVLEPSFPAAEKMIEPSPIA